MAGKRLVHDAHRAQYEIRGFAAGHVAHDLEHLDELAELHEERFGSDPLLREMRRLCRQALRDTRAWMSHARFVTDYDAARKAVEAEREET